mmetsp:Transcript_7913/g.33089  ORF Transcript_7913/g.33089 Transcript_7913/m.33089 type:complete len:331 (+) Transcript_7913:400-1392(+)
MRQTRRVAALFYFTPPPFHRFFSCFRISLTICFAIFFADARSTARAAARPPLTRLCGVTPNASITSRHRRAKPAHPLYRQTKDRNQTPTCVFRKKNATTHVAATAMRRTAPSTSAAARTNAMSVSSCLSPRLCPSPLLSPDFRSHISSALWSSFSLNAARLSISGDTSKSRNRAFAAAASARSPAGGSRLEVSEGGGHLESLLSSTNGPAKRASSASPARIAPASNPAVPALLYIDTVSAPHRDAPSGGRHANALAPRSAAAGILCAASGASAASASASAAARREASLDASADSPELAAATSSAHAPAARQHPNASSSGKRSAAVATTAR